MEAIVQTKSVAELRQIQQKREKKMLEEQEHRRKLEQAESQRLEREKQIEQERLESKRKQAIQSSQININSLSDRVSNVYTDLCSRKNAYKRKEQALAQKQDEYNVFLMNKDEAYPVKEYNERETIKMRNGRLAYYGLPIADIIFAYLAILPIAQSKLIAGFPEEIKDIMPLLGGLAAIFLGTALTLLGRWGKSSINKEWYGYPLLTVTALIVPAMYWVHFFVYSGKTDVDIAYAAIFSLVSLIIQLWIIVAYPKHIDALAYFKDKKKNEAIKSARDRQNAALNAEIERLAAELDKQPADFYSSFNQEFGAAFRNLAVARRTHINEHDEEPIIPLDWKTIYVGNAMFFQRPEIPLPLLHQDLSVTAADISSIEDMFREFGWEVHLMQPLLLNNQISDRIESDSMGQLSEPTTTSESTNTDTSDNTDDRTPPLGNDDPSSDDDEQQGTVIW
ncbi:hypothetical protein [Parabacteroides sp. PF5-9]|uniref:hypothetical protein n=1 Tax=Parabacteroides sp. PF5-9 TaxID=1742404 RepID=UPI002474606B|nr:hypothetical protein [Parabacteroides sp. PF5-9]MDH6357801.1 hypothetical protein [Parabacteroides sp. PF5-9]